MYRRNAKIKQEVSNASYLENLGWGNYICLQIPTNKSAQAGVEKRVQKKTKMENAVSVDRTRDLQIFSLTVSQLSYPRPT